MHATIEDLAGLGKIDFRKRQVCASLRDGVSRASKAVRWAGDTVIVGT